MSLSKVVVLGQTGQVGSACLKLLGEAAVGLDRPDIDLTQVDALCAQLDALQPTAVINAAAYTAVERAEDEEAVAHLINGVAPGRIAGWCAERDVPFVHYSTDYVFSGDHAEPWREDDVPHPINAYGRSKLAGERSVADAGGRWLVFRTSWVYDESGQSFFTTMARLGRERDTLKVVQDQVGAPTYAGHLARGTLQGLTAALAAPRFPSGIYHLCNGGQTSWYDFATAIFDGLRTRGVPLQLQHLVPTTTAEYGGKVARPLDSRLNTERAATVLGTRLPAWQDGLAACLCK